MSRDIITLNEANFNKKYIVDEILYKKNSQNIFDGYGIHLGTIIKPIFSAPSNNPRAYEIMGTVIAIRNEDSKSILVKEL